MEVVAKTFESIEYDRLPQEVRGTLTVRHIQELDYDQYLVDGIPIDPETVIIENVLVANQWVTLDSGQHVFIGASGQVMPKGPGKSEISDAGSGKQTTAKTSPKKKATTTRGVSTTLQEVYKAGENISREGLHKRLEEAAKKREKEAPADASPTKREFFRQQGMADELEKVMDEAGVATKAKHHSMSNTEPMRSMKIDGVNVMWPVGNDIAKRLSAESTAEILSANPPKALWGINKNIVYSTQKNSDDEYWEKQYSMPKFEAAATGGGGTIVSYGGRKMDAGTFYHETGHNVANKLWGDTDPPGNTYYGRSQKVEPPVTKYGANSSGEDFAEAVKLYMGGEKSRGEFKQQFPLKFASLEKHLKEI